MMKLLSIKNEDTHVLKKRSKIHVNDKRFYGVGKFFPVESNQFYTAKNKNILLLFALSIIR